MEYMTNLKADLIIKTLDYELKIISLEEKYRKKHKIINEGNMEKYINCQMKKETRQQRHIR